MLRSDEAPLRVHDGDNLWKPWRRCPAHASASKRRVWSELPRNLV